MWARIEIANSFGKIFRKVLVFTRQIPDSRASKSAYRARIGPRTGRPAGIRQRPLDHLPDEDAHA